MRNLFTLTLIIFSINLFAQNIDLANGVFGNEWIDYEKSYVKINVAEDNLYKITYQELVDAGVPINDISPSSIRLQNLGEDVYFYSTTWSAGSFSTDDYILFYGKQNRAELDKYLFDDPELQMMNHRYSMFSDTSAYFLSWENPINNNLIKEEVVDYNQSFPETRVYIHKEEEVYSQFSYKPVVGTSNVRYSSFRVSEGFGSGLQDEFNISFEVENRINIGRKPRLTYRMGTNRTSLNASVRLNGNSFVDYFSPGVTTRVLKLDSLLDYALISDEFNLQITTSVDNKIHLGHISFEYTRTIDAALGIPNTITIPASDKEQYLRIKNYSGEPLNFINKNNNTLYNATIQNNNLVLYLPASNVDQELILVKDLKNVKIAPVSFIDFSKIDHDYILLTSSKLNNSNDGPNPLEAYADYKASIEGGSYDPVVINVEDLYDQFSFGINRHSLAIRHFIHFIHSNWTNPRFFFIVGKSREYNGYRKDFQIEDSNNESFYVPTYGYPGGDNLFASQVNFATLLIPIGRIAARNKQDVFNYLDKVRWHDGNKNNPQTIEDKLWTKKILHLSGGDKDIQASIRSYLSDMEDVIENSKMGAEVTTFYKFSSDPIDEAFSESLRNLINNGLEVITFFGHSAPGVLDFSIGDVNDYDNFGKYPVMIALGCSAGNIHTSSENGISEEFVITKDKGGVVFLASASSAYANQQYGYGVKFYDLIGSTKYGDPIGESVNAIIDTFKFRTDDGYKTFLEQLTFHGDPSIRLNSYDSPDLIPDGSSATTIPQNVNSYSEDFEFCFDLVNIGSYENTQTEIELIHQLQDERIVTDTLITIQLPKYKERICVKLPIKDNSEVGEQTIKVIVDPNNTVIESPSPLAESNNTLLVNNIEGYKFFVINNTAQPVFPKEFGIINEPNPTLIASTYNGFSDAADYIIQFDTTANFNSPSLVETKLLDQRAAIQWETPYPLIHNTVYYWRVAADTTGTNLGIIWNESSFLYHQDIESGWNQSHYDQFIKDEFNNIMFNENTKKLEFENNFTEIRILNKVFKSSDDRPHFYVTGNSFNEAMDRRVGKSIAVSLIDSTGQFIKNPKPGIYGTINNYSVPITTYFFKTDNQESRSKFIQFVNEFIPNNTYVFFHTFDVEGSGSFNVEDWENDFSELGASIYSVLEDNGAELVSAFKEGEVKPYVFVFIKGGEVIGEQIALDRNSETSITTQVPGFWFEGEIYSRPIGPARKWNKLTWNEGNTNVTDFDSTYVRVWGLNSSLERSTILLDKNISLEVDLSTLNANNYPYIQLEYYAKDQRFLTPINLLQWRVFYEQTNELALIYNDQYSFYKDSIQQGDVLKLKLPVQNISPVGNPNVTANLYLKDAQNNIETKEINLGNMPPNNIKYIDYELETLEKYGDYTLSIIVNEKQNPTENYYFNNFANRSFEVYKDNTNPTLDVTFDGNHILDNDIVSSKPFIQISVQDENPFLLLNDPSLYDIVLINPDNSIDSVRNGDSRVTFIAASDSSSNKATIEFRPEFEMEGDFLLKVQSTDRTQNEQGEKAYEVSFKVILKNAISNVFNYPNPFSTSTEFIFTLTGSTIPDQMVIQIMTISGKVVREIKKEELGPIKLGQNRTEYKWDGRDEYGNLLGNGVYLYRLITSKTDGKSYENFALPEDTNRYFKEGWGKMVIIR